MVTRALRPADELLSSAVGATLGALTLGPEDGAASRLARTLAEAIDQAEDRQDALERLGPKLLACLDALGATPAARARLRGGVPTRAENRLAALRAARR